MALRPATAVGAVVLVTIGLSAAPARAVAPTVIKGKLSPGKVKLPKSARKGQAQVIAMNVDTSAFGGAAHVSRRGRYTLKLPAGKWALRSSVVSLGKPFASFQSARIVARAGQRRTLPLTLKRFKKPRRVKRRAHRSNINPRDGRAYKGEAIGIERFDVVGGNSEVGPLGNGIPEMLITDLLQSPRCPMTIVEMRHRQAILDEQAFQQSEHVDPASRVEPGHLIDPEILLRGRVEDRPGTPHRVALFAWLVDARTGERISEDVSSVALYSAIFESEERLALLVQRDLICARADRSAPTPPAPAGVPVPDVPVCLPSRARSSCPLPPTPPVPPAAPDTYTGTFSGEADSAGADTHWTWHGTVVMDAAADQSHFPPNGAPAGNYRVFTVTSGEVDLTLTATATSGCTFAGTKHLDVMPGLINTLTLQLDDASPAYALQITGSIQDTLDATHSGTNCPNETTTPFSIYPTWASTGSDAHTSPTLNLVDSQAELTPESPFDFDSTMRWSLSPG
ncbi:MAG: hypothetical protein ABI611_15215 [Solirubrobacteraceae bacterium]